jgi:hypothetical protein
VSTLTNLSLNTCHLHQVPMWCEHHIVISVSKVEIIDLEIWDQSQLWSNCVYPIQEAHSDQHVLEVTQDTIRTNRTSQRGDAVEQDRWDLLRIHQIVVVLAYFLIHDLGWHRSTFGLGGCFQYARR